MSNWEKFFAVLVALFVVPIMVMTFWMLFAMLPVMMYAEYKCAEKGYPSTQVTWNLNSYCRNLDGSVTVKMEKL